MLLEPQIQGEKELMHADDIVNILLVDDRKEDLMALQLVLENEGYNFVKATSGREALRILLKEHDFALILMDVHMPIMDGFETAKLIRESERLKAIPIIFLTANNDKAENIFKGYQTGAVDFMIKPVIPEFIRAKVGVFTELYKKTKQLQVQKKNLLELNKELEQRTEEIIRSNKELEKFAYVASHDMQEPLRTIISYIQLLEERFHNQEDKEAKQYMDFIVSAGYRMRDLITGLLEYSRINRKEIEPQDVDCNLVLSEVLANLGNSIQENHVSIIADQLPTISGNHFQMVQLFQNIISNAIKFKSLEREPKIKVSYKKSDGTHLFSIEDNGIGIEQKYATRIFEIFQRLHPLGEYPGMGIGLAICKKIVERHGGKIWLDSVPQSGSTFFFTLSIAATRTQQN